MSVLSDAVLFFVNLAFNLLVFGCLVAAGVAVSFRLIKNANPRLRYVVAVATFMFAALAPLAATFTGSIGAGVFIEARHSGVENSFDAAFSSETFATVPEIVSPLRNFEPKASTRNFLNSLTAAVADSLLGKILFSLWILGTGGFVWRDALSIRQLRKARRLWREATDAEREALDCSDKTRLYFGEDSPATIGFFRLAIVLPEHFPDDLSLVQKRCIARHELSHARWRDPLVGFALRLIRALFWISPALWMLERIAVGERESAADRAAVANFSENESQYHETALSYAATIVSVAKHFNLQARHDFFGANTVGFYNGSILENRVRRLLTRSQKTTSFRAFSAAATVFVGSIAGLFFMPIAFQSEAADFEAQAAVVNYQGAEEAIQNENFNDLQTRRRQNEPPQVEDKETKISAANQNENQSESFLAARKKNLQIPRVVMVDGKSVINSDGEAIDDTENSMRKISEEDAQPVGLKQKLDELSGKVQTLDVARKTLGSDISQVRQIGAAQGNSQMRKNRTIVNTNRSINQNTNTNLYQ